VVFSGKTLINSVLIAGAELAIPAGFEPATHGVESVTQSDLLNSSSAILRLPNNSGAGSRNDGDVVSQHVLRELRRPDRFLTQNMLLPSVHSIVRRAKISDNILDNINILADILAEGVGFEPTVPLQARRFSRPVP
jgi:hypothetical protein